MSDAYTPANIAVILTDKRVTDEHLGKALRERYQNTTFVPNAVQELVHRACVISLKEPRNENSIPSADHR